jgi:hypothetical protein
MLSLRTIFLILGDEPLVLLVRIDNSQKVSIHITSCLIPPIDKKRDLLYSVIQSRTNYRSIYTILLGVRTTIYNTRCYVSTLYAYCWFLDISIYKTKIFGKTYAHTKNGIDLFFKAASTYRCTVSFLTEAFNCLAPLFSVGYHHSNVLWNLKFVWLIERLSNATMVGFS